MKRILKTSLLLVALSFMVCKGSLSLADSGSYTKTKYPIVMVPGAFAFDSILGVLDYWYGITDALRAQGSEVYVTNLSSSSHIVTRGEELLADVEKILALTGAEKVNLIAHSQGATASRYVAALLPERISSISCIHCMNEGTGFADNLYDFVNKHPFVKMVVNVVASSAFTALEFLSGAPSDGSYNSKGRALQIAEHLVISAGSKSHETFNALFPDGLSELSCDAQGSGVEYLGVGGSTPSKQKVHYYSMGGVQAVTNPIDPLDALVVPVIKLFYPKGHIWDGLVPSCGHPLGDLVEGFYPISHFDAINQTFGLVESGVDVPSLYAIHVNRLKTAGM